jgi:hypothetical protein
MRPLEILDGAFDHVHTDAAAREVGHDLDGRGGKIRLLIWSGLSTASGAMRRLSRGFQRTGSVLIPALSEVSKYLSNQGGAQGRLLLRIGQSAATTRRRHRYARC